MTEAITLAAQPRDTSKNARALRREQIVPAIMYGRSVEATSVQFDYPSLVRVLREAGASRLVTVTIEGTEGTHDVFFRQVQFDPVTANVIHVDLYAVLAGEKVTNFVPIVQVGEAPVVDKGGVVMQTVDRLEVECFPRDMPASIAVDISVLRKFGDRVTVAELVIPENVTVLDDLTTEIVTALAPSTEFEELEEAEEGIEEAAEGEEAEGAEEEPSEASDDEG